MSPIFLFIKKKVPSFLGLSMDPQQISPGQPYVLFSFILFYPKLYSLLLP